MDNFSRSGSSSEGEDQPPAKKGPLSNKKVKGFQSPVTYNSCQEAVNSLINTGELTPGFEASTAVAKQILRQIGISDSRRSSVQNVRNRYFRQEFRGRKKPDSSLEEGVVGLGSTSLIEAEARSPIVDLVVPYLLLLLLLMLKLFKHWSYRDITTGSFQNHQFFFKELIVYYLHYMKNNILNMVRNLKAIRLEKKMPHSQTHSWKNKDITPET